MSFKLGEKSLTILGTVHADLQKVVKRAIEITEVDFTLLEGIRTIDTQISYVNRGVSKTMLSRHLSGMAADLGAFVDGKVSWDMKHYLKIFKAMQTAAKELNIPIRSGLDWDTDGVPLNDKSTLIDGPHFELQKQFYPDKLEVLAELKKRNLIK